VGTGRLEPGNLIADEFIVGEALRVGRFSTVYRAVRRSTGQRCVVAVLSPVLGDIATRERLASLAFEGPAIESDHVPEVLDTGVDAATGVVWLATDDIEGEGLPAVLAKTGPLPIAVVSTLMRQVFDAMASAHEVGVVHGALSAEDLIVAPAPGKGAWRVSVLGFGVASGVAELRWEGAQGEDDRSTPRSADLRGLGMLAFTMLSGGRGRGAGDGSMELAPTARLRQLGVPEVGALGWFDEWFEECVASDPEAQFPSVLEAESAWEHGVAVPWRPGRWRWALPAAALVALGAAAVAVHRRVRSPGAGVHAVAHRPAATRTACPPGMVWLPGGQFMMGSRDDRGESDQRPRHVVNISGFCMDRTEVTVGAYGRYWVLRGHPPELAPDEGFNCNWRRPERVDHPMNCIDWRSAREYCEWSGHPGGPRRLPTEAQWEYAAHGQEGGRYPWGNGVPGERVCWSGVSPRLGTCRVGESSRDVTSTGLVDMAGNVAEWTADLYASYVVPDAAVRFDPTGPESTPEGLRVFRGGTWAISVPSGVRAATRGRHTETMRSRSVGWRCARGPTGDDP
jgi:formylglycine-generating enzyme required for sulfatase activity